MVDRNFLNRVEEEIGAMAREGTPDLDYESEFYFKVFRRALGMLNVDQVIALLAWVYETAIQDSDGELAELANLGGWPEGTAAHEHFSHF